jgi:ribonuclease J
MLRDKKRMFYDGSVVASVVLDDAGAVMADPLVSVLGMSDPLEDADRDWAWVIQSAIDRLPKKARRDDDVIEENVRQAVRKVFAPVRKPVVRVHVSRV